MHASLVFELKYGNLPGHNNLTTKFDVKMVQQIYVKLARISDKYKIIAVQETAETNTIILIYINMLS